MAAMATVAQVCTALKAKVDGISGITVYDTAPESVVAPAAIIVPGPLIEHTINRRNVTREYRIILLVAKTAEAAQQKTLFGYLDNFGTSSVRAAIEADKSLGLTGVEAAHKGDEGLTETTWGNVDYFGATITVHVTTQGDS